LSWTEIEPRIPSEEEADAVLPTLVTAVVAIVGGADAKDVA